MKFFIDTNILFSMFILHSKFVTNNVKKCLGEENKWCTSDYCISEMGRIITKKVGINIRSFRNIATDIECILFDSELNIVSDSPKDYLPLKTRDKNDDRVLNAAINCHADFLITGDRDLLEFKTDLIKIISPSMIGQILNINL